MVRQWVRDDEADLLVILASTPADSDPVEDEGPRRMLGISGDTDGLVSPEEFTEGNGRFEDPELWVIEGMNHFGWTDDVTNFEKGLDGELLGDLDELRTTANVLIDEVLLGIEIGPIEVDGAEEVMP